MNYYTIKPVSIENGPGVRVSLFVCGCPIRCEGCHNSELFDFNSGKEFTLEELKLMFNMLRKPHIEGLSVLGGEPLAENNVGIVTILCKTFKGFFPNKSIWLYTGYLYENVKHLKVMEYIDVLVDGPYVESKRNPTLKFKGSTNQRIINVKEGEVIG